jgi:tRNA(Ile2)-agmatinylcytidine synthase
VTVVGIDDTDSRTTGMCTTYAAHRVAERLRSTATVDRLLLVRLNPAVEHKTRGNAALAVHTDATPERALAAARAVVGDDARSDEPDTNPGVVVAPGPPDAVPERVAEHARRAIREHCSLAAVRTLLAATDLRCAAWGDGRGLVGAAAAVGAWRGRGPEADWTHERIGYRTPDRVGTERTVDHDSVFAAAERGYPAVWDTVDRETGEVVCVPHTPGPVLYGVRGDDPATVRAVAEGVDAEPVAAVESYLTNQGTDDHLRTAPIPAVRDGHSYRVPGVVVDAPETRRGGHVHLTLADPGESRSADGLADPLGDGGRAATDAALARWALDRSSDALPASARLPCVAFEPTGRFRDRVRGLVVGDRVLVCGEVADGHLKLEKFALRARRSFQRVVPRCPDCERSMESAGADQGYRCRDCATSRPGRVERPLDRDLDHGWYEVPPTARRHVAKPLVRGGFDAPTHPER